MSKSIGKWKLPQPTDIKEENEWVPIPRIARTIPFGYKQSEEDIPVEGFAIANDSGEIVFEFYVNEKNSETYLNSLSVGGITNEAVEEMKRLKIKKEEEKLETQQGLLEAMLLENHVFNIRN